MNRLFFSCFLSVNLLGKLIPPGLKHAQCIPVQAWTIGPLYWPLEVAPWQYKHDTAAKIQQYSQ